MKGLKVLLAFLLVVSMVFGFGCAARQTVQKEPTQDIESTGEVEEPADMPGKSSRLKYVVKKGDTLWDISGMGKIYKDNFLWPLLFKANRDQIEDPDIIEIGQELIVRKDWSNAEKMDARQKAKDTPPYVPHTKPRKKLPLEY